MWGAYKNHIVFLHPGNIFTRGRTVLHKILDNHFTSFVENYEEKYAEECGKYSLERITSVVEEYLKCGDFKHGVARVKCINPECNNCKIFYYLILICFFPFSYCEGRSMSVYKGNG